MTDYEFDRALLRGMAYALAAFCLYWLLGGTNMAFGVQRGIGCPCNAVPLYGAFTSGQRRVLTCTDQTPVGYQFVRVVATNTDLIVAMTWTGQFVCGYQPRGHYATLLPITTWQYETCRADLRRIAARQGVRCGVEDWR